MSGPAMSELTIRDFAPRDQQAARNLILAGLAERFGFLDETLNPDLSDIQVAYVASGGRFLVATDGERLVATGALSLEACPGGHCGRLERISVDRSYRRRGIARRIIAQLIESARAAGMGRLLIETEQDWRDAIDLYLSFGFREYLRTGTSVHFALEL